MSPHLNRDILQLQGSVHWSILQAYVRRHTTCPHRVNLLYSGNDIYNHVDGGVYYLITPAERNLSCSAFNEGGHNTEQATIRKVSC